MNQREMISKFIDENRMKMNPELFERSDDEIMNMLMAAIKSCEREGQYFSIKVAGFEVIDDFDEINKILFDYYEKAFRNETKTRRKDNRYGFINLNESVIRLLIIHYDIADKERKDKLDVIVAVPRIIDKYYFLIDGIMRSTLYQAVDGSTYNNATSMSKSPSVTLKLIFMAVRIFRHYVDMPTADGKTVRGTYYHALSFNKTVPAISYILAKFGFYGALDFMGINYISITNEPVIGRGMLNIMRDEHLYINVPQYFFDNDLITQSFVCTLYNTIYPSIPICEYYKQDYWIRSLGALFNRFNIEKFTEIFTEDDKNMVSDTLDKGYSILDSFESIYDYCTYEALKLTEEDKGDIYRILRWMLREFNALRIKDNLDISIKRIRFSEYVASLYVMKIARGIYRVADANKRASIEGIIRAIKTDPQYLLKAIVMSKMISYRNMVSDMDSMQALKFTYKGISGLGEGGNRSIPDIYRFIQPSHIGRVDIDASSDGNPGITGTLNPFMDMHDGYFSDYQEPDTWREAYANTMRDFEKARKLKNAMVFEQTMLGVDNIEKIQEIDDITANMEQIIKPISQMYQQGLIFEE